MKKIIICVVFLFVGTFSFSEQQEPSIITAAKTENIEVIQFLLNKGADINECDQFGDTALLIAVAGKNIPLIKYLVEHGANVNPKPGYRGSTPLSLAIKKGNMEIIKYLTDHGAKIVQKNKK